MSPLEAVCFRWGVVRHAMPADVDTGKILGISVLLGGLFNEDARAERHWVHQVNAELGGRSPWAMIRAGNVDAVLDRVREICGL
jgi:hypothetical protein